MEFDLITIIKELGIPVALIVYFTYKDWKFTEKLTSLLTKIEVYVSGGAKDE